MSSKPRRSSKADNSPADSLQRPPAEIQYAEQLAQLQARDKATARPPGWQLSLPAARSFILGDSALGIAPKVVLPIASIERMLVTLATGWRAGDSQITAVGIAGGGH